MADVYSEKLKRMKEDIIKNFDELSSTDLIQLSKIAKEIVEKRNIRYKKDRDQHVDTSDTNYKVERAMMIHVGCIGWNWPKSILVSTDEDYGKRLDEVAKEAFQKYKSTQQNQDIYLFNYSYQGDVEILTE